MVPTRDPYKPNYLSYSGLFDLNKSSTHCPEGVRLPRFLSGLREPGTMAFVGDWERIEKNKKNGDASIFFTTGNKYLSTNSYGNQRTI